METSGSDKERSSSGSDTFMVVMSRFSSRNGTNGNSFVIHEQSFHIVPFLLKEWDKWKGCGYFRASCHWSVL